jgi:peptidyl-prolyl cis-trans isomerase B (cyclophilin B)
MLRLSFCALFFAALTASVSAQEKKDDGAGKGTNPVVLIETSLGKIKVELFKDKAPVTVKNFLQYVEDGHYDNTICHRIIKDFMIQGGGLSTKLEEKKTREPIKNEAGNGLSNVRGTLAMARTNDPDSATCQFFINVVDNTRLDRQPGAGKEGYAVFGRVIEGMDVVDEIRAVETDRRDMPTKHVVIKQIRLEEKK